MHIDDSENTENILQRINYYRLTAYGHTSKDPHNKEQYLKESTTSKMYSFYEFDRKYGSFGIHWDCI